MHFPTVVLLTTLLTFVAFQASDAQVQDLARKLPADANVVIGIDVAALNSASLAEKEGWTRKLEDAFVDRAVFLPPEAKAVVIASQLFPERNFQQLWEAAVMAIDEPISMRSYARAEGGYVDEIDGIQTVWSPSDAYLAPLDEQVLGIFYPASRQVVARWLETSQADNAIRLSPILDSALQKVGPETQIAVAIDLQHIASPHLLESNLQDAEAVSKGRVSLTDAVKLLTSLEGVVIEVSVGETAVARSRIAFSQEVRLTEAVAKQMVLDALDKIGLRVDEFADHQFKVDGYSITAEGPLTTDGLRRMLSVIEIPTTKFSQVDPELVGKESSADDVATASQAYFKSVLALLDDLRTDRNKTSTHGGMDAVWMDRYARKIDRLPILNVDDDLLEWGTKTAETLRVMSSARKGAGLAAGAQKSTLRTDAYSGNYYNYTYGNSSNYNSGGTSATETAKNKAQIDRQYQNRATAKRVEGWQLIDDATADIRRQMTQKYQIEF